MNFFYNIVSFYRIIILSLLFSNNLFSQLNSFYDVWVPRSFSINFNNLDNQNEINSPANVQITINPNNIIAQVLPSHFGTNLTHFLGQSVINNSEFIHNMNI